MQLSHGKMSLASSGYLSSRISSSQYKLFFSLTRQQGGAVWTLRLPFPPPLPLHTENNSMMPSKYSFFSSLWFEITHPVLNWKLPVRNVNPTPYLCMPNFLRPSTKKIQKLCQIEFHFINSKIIQLYNRNSTFKINQSLSK